MRLSVVRSKFPNNKVAPFVTHKGERERIEFLEAKCVFLQSENDELYSSLKTQANEIDKIKQLLEESEAMRRTLEKGLTETLSKVRAEKITEERITVAEDRMRLSQHIATVSEEKCVTAQTLLNSQRTELHNYILSLQGKLRGISHEDTTRSVSDATLAIELNSTLLYIDKMKNELESETRAKRTAHRHLQDIRSLLTKGGMLIRNPVITKSGDILEKGWEEESGCFFKPKSTRCYEISRIADIINAM